MCLITVWHIRSQTDRETWLCSTFSSISGFIRLLICEDECGGLAVDLGFEMSSSLSPRIENVSLCISPSLYDLNTYFPSTDLSHTDSNKDIFVDVSTIFLLS